MRSIRTGKAPPMRRHLLVPLTLASLISFTLVAAQSSSGDPPGPPAGGPGGPGGPPKLDPRMPELFLAVGRDDPAGVRRALARGVSPEVRNIIEFTPLMFAAMADRRQAAEALLAAGAKLDAPSPYGGALTAAETEGNTELALLLLERGAAPEAKRADGIQPLMLAAWHDHVELARRLLSRGAKVDTRDSDGATALSYAARSGSAAAARLLLEHDAEPDAADSRGWTPLMYAAANGRVDLAGMLVSKGARVNAKEASGRTPLLLAAAYSGDPGIAKALLDGGADRAAVDGRGRTAAAIAAGRGYREMAELLGGGGPRAAAAPAEAARTSRQAAESGLKVVEAAQGVFLKKLGCASCHHQSLGMLTSGEARRLGFAVDGALIKRQIERCAEGGQEMAPFYEKAAAHPELAAQIPFSEIQEATTGETFILAGLAACGVPANPGLSVTALALARRQQPDGRWSFLLRRVPMQSSDFTFTALAIRSLKAYAGNAQAADTAARITRARKWLLAAAARNGEDRAFRLLGLKWAGAKPEEMRRAVEEIRAEQRTDGGWAELGSLKSDAYATGQALYALNAAGAPFSDPALQKGVAFLLRTQDDDGSWFVNKRAAPLNFYTDVGFPHGESQYSSFAGTCWATMALMKAAGPAAPARTAASR